MKKRTGKKEEELREKKRLQVFAESVDEDDDEDAGEDDELPKLYKNAREEILAEFGPELIGGYYWDEKEGKKRKRAKRLPVTLPRGECLQIMNAYTEGKWAFRNNLISRLMYTTGIRLAEEAYLSVADINFEDETGFVRMGKEGKDRYVCIDPGTMKMLKEWIGDRAPTESLFGISDGMKLFALKKLMGHEYLATTMNYVDTAMAFEREEYKKTGPLSGDGGRGRKRRGR